MAFQYPYLESLLAKDEDDLYTEFGGGLQDALHADEPSEEEKAAVGRQWFGENRARLRELLCKDGTYERLQTASDRNDVQFALYLADLIAHHFVAIPPFTLAVILVRTGGSRLCAE